MYMHCQSVIFDGDEYWDCIEIPCLLRSLLEDSAGSSGYSSSEQNDSLASDLHDFAFEELGETAAVQFC